MRARRRRNSGPLRVDHRSSSRTIAQVAIRPVTSRSWKSWRTAGCLCRFVQALVSASSIGAPAAQLVERLWRQVFEPLVCKRLEALATDDVLERTVDRVRRARRAEHLTRFGDEVEFEV